jgi:hypothetical protein
MLRMGFNPTSSAFQQAEEVHAVYSASNVMGN